MGIAASHRALPRAGSAKNGRDAAYGSVPMLKKIAVADLRLGMCLHRFEGAWIDHPFWRTRLLIDDPADLLAAQRSGLHEC